MTDRYPKYPGHKLFDTSREAVDAISGALTRLHAIAYAAAARVGALGLMAHETAEQAGLPKETIQPRLSELRIKGRIVDSGKRAAVWAAKGIMLDG